MINVILIHIDEKWKYRHLAYLSMKKDNIGNVLVKFLPFFENIIGRYFTTL